MTSKKDVELVCANCSAPIAMEYHQSVNTLTDPQLVDKILELRLNTAECNQCGQRMFIDDFFVYNDPESRLFLIKHPLTDLDTWEETLTGMKDYWKQLPESLQNPDVVRRTVFGPFALKEKILIFRDGLDEKATEIYKIGLFGQMGEKYFNRKYRLFYFEKQDDLFIFVLVDLNENKEISVVKVPIETFADFKSKSLPEMLEKPLVKHILQEPFVSMEKMYFAKELVDKQMN